MHLRSGRHLHTPIRSRTPSRVPTQASGTQSVGNLADFLETSSDSQSETPSQTNSTMSQDREGLGNGHPLPPNRTPSQSINPFDADDMALPLNARLQYIYTNAQGVDRDPKQRYVVKITNFV